MQHYAIDISFYRKQLSCHFLFHLSTFCDAAVKLAQWFIGVPCQCTRLSSFFFSISFLCLQPSTPIHKYPTVRRGQVQFGASRCLMFEAEFRFAFVLHAPAGHLGHLSSAWDSECDSLLFCIACVFGLPVPGQTHAFIFLHCAPLPSFT